jgi:hypothetical protein
MHFDLLNWAAPFFQSSVTVITGCSKQSWAWLEAAAAVVTRTRVKPKLSANHSNKSVTPPLSSSTQLQATHKEQQAQTPESSTRQLLAQRKVPCMNMREAACTAGAGLHACEAGSTAVACTAGLRLHEYVCLGVEAATVAGCSKQ